MGKNNPRNSGGPGPDSQTIYMAVIVITAVSILGTAQLGALAGWKFDGAAKPPVNPFETFTGLFKGDVRWTIISTVTAVALWTVIGALVYLWVRSKPKKSRTTTRQAARYLAPKSQLATMSRKAAEKKAVRFVGEDLAADYPGLRMGKDLQSKRAVYSSWEDLYLVIFGPRRGKTTSQVIPAIVDAPGHVITTSNKRDIVDDTIELMRQRGQTWVFDPQRIASGLDQTPWFFDPLDLVRRDPHLMDSAAMRLASIFRAAELGANVGSDAFFSEGGKELLAQFFLAAALDNRPISDVYLWVSDDGDRTPIGILEQFPEWKQQAVGLAATYRITEKTRSGIFSQAKKMAASLGRREALKWVTSTEGAKKFIAEKFVRGSGRDTVYVLSKEGDDNAAALTTALIASITTTAEKYGEEKGGRLPVPLVAALDEAANIVRWPELPNLYSHYGSRGIILMTILQSYAQGVEVWGENGMELLWSAASVVLYGGGVRDEKMLHKLESLIGDYEELSKSVSRSADGGRSTSVQAREKKILTAAELAALPFGQALAFTGRQPFLLELEPYWTRGYWDDHTRQLLPGQR